MLIQLILRHYHQNQEGTHGFCVDGVEGEEGGGDGREAGGGGEDAAADGGDERRGQGVQKDVGRVKAPAAPRTQRVVQPGIRGEKINEDDFIIQRLPKPCTVSEIESGNEIGEKYIHQAILHHSMKFSAGFQNLFEV